jgi:hypothetical protein
VGVAHSIWRLSRSAGDELRVGSEAALGTGLPGEPLEKTLASVSSQSLRQTGVTEDLGESLTELGDVSRLDHETGEPVLDHFGEAADPTRDDGRPARHRLDARQAE